MNKLQIYQLFFFRSRCLKVILVQALFFFSFSVHLLAQDYSNPPKFQLSIQPIIGYKAGSIGEYLFNTYVYGKPTTYAPRGSKQISFLEWNIDAMMVSGVEISTQYKSFFTLALAEFGIPLSTGKMDDFDWASTKGHQTHFSTHQNKITDHFILRGLVGWEFSPKSKRFQIIPMIGGSWQQTSMVASNGYRQYVPSGEQETTPWTDDIEKVYFEGDVISYRHVVFQIDLLLRVQYNFTQKIRTYVDAAIYPVIDAYGFDTHILRNTQFLDRDMRGQIAFGVALGVNYQLFHKKWLTLTIDYNYLPVVTGKTYLRYVGQPHYYREHGSLGGASHWFVGVTLGFKFNVFE